MNKILFASDLDNTLLFSWRHKTDSDQCVEHLDGKEQGFCTQQSLELLASVCEQAQFVPVTTRSVAQYQRIAWPAPCAPEFAVAANGGILLVNGVVDSKWYMQTQELSAPWWDELLYLQSRLPEAPMCRRWRIVDGLYLFAVCGDEESAQAGRRFFEGGTGLNVEASGRKLYFFPPPINKGDAVSRLRARFLPDKVSCAGDSVIDVPMLRAADIAIFPDADLMRGEHAAAVMLHSGAERFPDFVLKSVLNEIRRIPV